MYQQETLNILGHRYIIKNIREIINLIVSLSVRTAMLILIVVLTCRHFFSCLSVNFSEFYGASRPFDRDESVVTVLFSFEIRQGTRFRGLQLCGAPFSLYKER